MHRRSFLLLGASLLANAAASAQTPAPTQADRIADALAPRRRRGGGVTAIDQAALDTVERLKEIRRRRGLSLLEQDELFAATSGMPQIDLEIYFPFDSAEITKAALPDLDGLGQALNRETFKSNTIVIGGHTDRKGTPEYNQALSERRAEAVVRYLSTVHKVDTARMLPSGFGFRKLKLPDQPYAGENRRVQIVNAAR